MTKTKKYKQHYAVLGGVGSQPMNAASSSVSVQKDEKQTLPMSLQTTKKKQTKLIEITISLSKLLFQLNFIFRTQN